MRGLWFATKAYIHSVCGRRSHFSKKPTDGVTICPKCWIALGTWQEDT